MQQLPVIALIISINILLIMNYFCTKRSILLRDLKFCWRSENNFVEILKICKKMSNAAKNFNILATSLNVLHNYFDGSTKLFF